jgi:hypothetical protein
LSAPIVGRDGIFGRADAAAVVKDELIDGERIALRGPLREAVEALVHHRAHGDVHGFVFEPDGRQSVDAVAVAFGKDALLEPHFGIPIILALQGLIALAIVFGLSLRLGVP